MTLVIAKKQKLLLVYVRVCARESEITGIFTIYIVVLHLLFNEGYFYSKSFDKNKPMFYEKQHVVLWKTSRRFMENNTSFLEGIRCSLGKDLKLAFAMRS